MGSFVGDDSVQLSITECSLVDREMGTEILGEEQPFCGVLVLFPLAEGAEMILVLFLKFFWVKIVGCRDRRK
jgi:hypothetical protein